MMWLLPESKEYLKTKELAENATAAEAAPQGSFKALFNTEKTARVLSVSG